MKKLLRFVMIVIAYALATTSYSQEIKVKSFSMQMEPMTIPMQRKDNNGNVCALVKVIIPSAQASFEGSLIGNCDFKTSEYWCYLSPGSKQLKIKYPNCEPIMVRFDDFIGSGVQSKQIYELTLSVPSFSQQNGSPLSVEIGFEKRDGLFCKDQLWRTVNDTIKPVTIYVNYKDGNYDEKVILDSEIHNEILLGNIVEGDKLTILPDSRQYQTLEYSVTEEDLTTQKKSLGIRKRLTEVSGTLTDERTGLPIPGVKLHFYPRVDYYIRFSYNSEYNKTIDVNSYTESITDTDGKFRVTDLIPGHVYDIRFTLPIGYISPNMPQDCSIFKHSYDYKVEPISSTPLDIHISPNKLTGYVTDGKKAIEGAKIECRNLYNDTITTDDNGYFEVFGYLKEDITITAYGYDTLHLYNSVEEYLNSWEERYMTTPLNIKMKKSKNQKLREGAYNGYKIEYF